MNNSNHVEAINQDRRRLLGTVALGIFVAGAASLVPTQLIAALADEGIRPFRVNIPEEQLARSPPAHQRHALAGPGNRQ